MTRYLATLTLIFLASACCTAQTRILPKGEGKAEIIAKSSEEACAYEKASEKAEEYCKRKGKSYVVLKDKSEYSGMDKTAKGTIEGAGALMGKSVYLSRSDDYKVRLLFRCK